MKFKSQKGLAAKVLKIGVNRVWFDPFRLEDIKQAITRADIKELVKDKAIKRKLIAKKAKKKIRKRKGKGRTKKKS